jgi:hypothetical protein
LAKGSSNEIPMRWREGQARWKNKKHIELTV